jgi:hypothetical protein
MPTATAWSKTMEREIMTAAELISASNAIMSKAQLLAHLVVRKPRTPEVKRLVKRLADLTAELDKALRTHTHTHTMERDPR